MEYGRKLDLYLSLKRSGIDVPWIPDTQPDTIPQEQPITATAGIKVPGMDELAKRNEPFAGEEIRPMTGYEKVKQTVKEQVDPENVMAGIMTDAKILWDVGQIPFTPIAGGVEATRAALSGAGARETAIKGLGEFVRPFSGIQETVTGEPNPIMAGVDTNQYKRMPQVLQEAGWPDWVAEIGGNTLELAPYFIQPASYIKGIMGGGKIAKDLVTTSTKIAQVAIEKGDYTTLQKIGNLLKEARSQASEAQRAIARPMTEVGTSLEQGAVRIPRKPAGVSKIPTVEAKAAQAIPKGLEPLAIEARKYKTAEEFLAKSGVKNTQRSMEWIKTIIEKNPDEKLTRKAINILADEKNNPNTRRAFELVYGEKLPPTEKASKVILEQISGLPSSKQWLTRGETEKLIEKLKGKEVFLDRTKRDWQVGRKSYSTTETPVKVIGLDGDYVVYKYKGATSENLTHIDNIRDIKVSGKSLLEDMTAQATGKVKPTPQIPPTTLKTAPPAQSLGAGKGIVPPGKKPPVPVPEQEYKGLGKGFSETAAVPDFESERAMAQYKKGLREDTGRYTEYDEAAALAERDTEAYQTWLNERLYPDVGKKSKALPKKPKEEYLGDLVDMGSGGMEPPKITIPSGAADLPPDKLYAVIKKATVSKLTSMREYVQDQFIRVRRLVDKADTVILGSDPYTKMALYPGRVNVRFKNVDRMVNLVDNDILTTAKGLKVDNKALITDIDDYLVAKHAPDYNKALGEKAAGMTDIDATNKLKAISGKGEKYTKEVDRIAKDIRKIHEETLNTLVEGEIITEEFAKMLRKKYPNHISLNRIMDSDLTGDIPDIITGGKGFRVSGTGLKKAVGSEREVADIMGNTISNLKAAIVRAEKNKIDLATLKFARDFEGKYNIGLFEELKAGSPGFKTPSPLDPSILALREKGQQAYLQINNPNLAVAFRGVGKETVPGLLKVAQFVSRNFSMLATRFNPEFAIPNMVRDIQEMVVYLAAQNEIGVKGALKASTREVGSMADVVSWMRGKDTPGAKLYQQMIMDGGTTGGMSQSTRQQIIADIESIRKLNRSNPRQAAEYVIGKIDQWNTIFEDSTRLSVYKEALSNGATRDRAAFLAKRATIDFNQMGKGGPIINSLYMFSNASIQGSAKMLSALKNPKVLAGLTTGVTTAVFVTGRWNDSIDPKWRDKVSKWDRMNSLIVMLPNGDYIKVPVSWGIKPIKAVADAGYDITTGYSKGTGETVDRIVTAVLDAYNPIGGTDIQSAFTPTIADIPFDIMGNQKWSGQKIKPDISAWNKGMPEHLRYYPSLRETWTGRQAIKGTQALSKGGIEVSPADIEYGYQQLIGGTGRFASKTAETGISLSKGEPPVVRSIPIVSRFYGRPENRSIPTQRPPMREIELYLSLKRSGINVPPPKLKGAK